MRRVPPEVAAQIRAIPTDFKPIFEDRDKPAHVRWSATIEIAGQCSQEVELGFSMTGLDRKAEASKRAELRAAAWQVLELARLDRGDLLDFVLVNRHGRRKPLPKPSLPTPPSP